jgi:predicted phage terminase large subunit-like protein
MVELTDKEIDESADEAARNDFDLFAQLVFPVTQPGVRYEWNWHIECISEHLQAMHRGEISRLIINLPPRSLKSYLVSQAFPAWVLGKDPTEKFINISYGESVVEQNAMKCRAIINSPLFKRMFPAFKIGLLDRIKHFETSMKGHYYADSALSTVTGIGCNYMVIDDPLKPMEALSDTVRNSTNENIRSTLLNRFDDKRIGKLLMVMQRVHTDDPTGNLLRDKNIVHLKLPGETKRPIHVQLQTPKKFKQWDMAENSLLFPERLSREILDQLRLDMTEYHYAGQILQEPVPLGGGEFKDTWIQYYEGGAVFPSKMNIAILCDPSGGEELNRKKKKSSDWTAFMVVGASNDNNYYLLDIVRDRLNPTDRIESLFTLHRKWNGLSGKPPKVGYEKYGLMSDTHYIKHKQKQDGYHFPLIELGGQMIKEERIRRLIPDMQQNRWYFPANLIYVDNEGRKFDLVSELVNSEMKAFPRGRFDDMLDALSRIYDAELGMFFPRITAKSPNIINMGKMDNDTPGWLDF